jgi:hypothetical protein
MGRPVVVDDDAMMTFCIDQEEADEKIASDGVNASVRSFMEMTLVRELRRSIMALAQVGQDTIVALALPTTAPRSVNGLAGENGALTKFMLCAPGSV